MIGNKTFSGENDLEISLSAYKHVLGLDIVMDGKFRIRNMSLETAHALADWILANVPKPEPTPLPTKFAAVVKADGKLLTLVEPEEGNWISSETGRWATNDSIRQYGFEVVYEGVDD